MPQHGSVVVVSGDEDLVFDVFGLSFGSADDWGKRIDDVVTERWSKLEETEGGGLGICLHESIANIVRS
jgi:hypothetical protein